MTEREILDAVRPWHCLMDPERELPALLSAFAGCRSVLEIGTYKGATAAALALALGPGVVTTLDLPDPMQAVQSNPQPSADCGAALRALGLEAHVEAVRMDSRELGAWVQAGRRFDGIFVDAEHTTEAVRRDLTHSASLLEAGGVIVAHDYTDPSDAQRPPWTVDVYEGVQAFLYLYPHFRVRRLAGWLAEIR